MSSNDASSSGIESDTDSLPYVTGGEEEEEEEANENNDSMETLIDDNDEGFINTKNDSKSTNKKINKTPKILSTTSKYKSSQYPRSVQNPYDDGLYTMANSLILSFVSFIDTNRSSVVEDWDEECKLTEPYCRLI